MIPVAPCDIVPVLNPTYPRVVCVVKPADFTVFTNEGNPLVIDIPVDPVPTETGMDLHPTASVVAAKNTCEAVLERNYRAVEILFDEGIASRNITGFLPERHTTSVTSSGLSSQGMLDNLLPLIICSLSINITSKNVLVYFPHYYFF